MLIIPAIDIMDKKCVRLFQGRFDDKIIFNSDPVDSAVNFARGGAEWLHVIDLDGARSGRIKNLAVVEEIKKRTGLKIQFGGGVRAASDMAGSGIDKFIIGTSAIEGKSWLNKIDKNKVIISIDAKDGKVMSRGWLNKNSLSVFDAIERLNKIGFREFIYTDVKKDGTLLGPNLVEISQLRNEFNNISLTAAGGIARASDINNLNKLGVDKIIIGKALYTNPLLKKYVSQKNYSLS